MPTQDPEGVIGKQSAGNALVFRDLLNAEGIRSKALAVCSVARRETNSWTVFYIYIGLRMCFFGENRYFLHKYCRGVLACSDLFFFLN